MVKNDSSDVNAWMLHALETLEAACILYKSPPLGLYPAGFLAHHSLELLLKAALLSHGASPKEVRNLRHNTVDAWEKLCAKVARDPNGSIREGLQYFMSCLEFAKYPQDLGQKDINRQAPEIGTTDADLLRFLHQEIEKLTNRPNIY
jgi:hypothetical protein